MRFRAQWLTAWILLAVAACGGDEEGEQRPREEGPTWGRFSGAAVTIWCDQTRAMKLDREFAYVDRHGAEWRVAKGTVIDGASIPRVFWVNIGSPYSGKYRRASIVHDAACYERTKPSDDVHRMFYEACRAGGVKERKAKTMYWAVRKFGPSWEVGDDPVEPPDCTHDPAGVANDIAMARLVANRTKESDDPNRDAQEQAAYESAAKWIDKENPSLDEIDAYDPQ